MGISNGQSLVWQSRWNKSFGQIKEWLIRWATTTVTNSAWLIPLSNVSVAITLRHYTYLLVNFMKTRMYLYWSISSMTITLEQIYRLNISKANTLGHYYRHNVSMVYDLSVCLDTTGRPLNDSVSIRESRFSERSA